MNLYTDIPYRNITNDKLVKIKAINDEEVIYNYIENVGAVGDFVTTVTNFMKHYEFVPTGVAPVDQERLSKLQSEVDYYRKELAKAHELLGRVTHQLSERWDSVRLTQFYPTDNLHGKRTLNNPTGSK